MKFLYLRDRLFLGGCALYCGNRFLLRPWVDWKVLRFWFNDFLLVACGIPVLFWIFRKLNLRAHDRPPSLAELGWIVAVWSVLFEWVGPRWLSVGTGDWVDVVMYCAGGLVSWCFWRWRGFVHHEDHEGRGMVMDGGRCEF